MNIIDISWPISGRMTHYKNKERFTLHKEVRDYITEHTICLHNHIGTHIDAPLHVMPAGLSIDQLPLSLFMGPCFVIDLSEVNEVIDRAILSGFSIPPRSRILLKTKNSNLQSTEPFYSSFVWLSADGAQFLIEKQIMLIGIDYLGIERTQPFHTTHKIFAKAGVPILEGLRLTHVDAGQYYLSALPINFIGLDAALTRAVLLKNEHYPLQYSV